MLAPARSLRAPPAARACISPLVSAIVDLCVVVPGCMSHPGSRDELPQRGEVLVVVDVSLRAIHSPGLPEPLVAYVVTVQWRRTGNVIYLLQFVLLTASVLAPRPPAVPPLGWF